MTESSIHLKAGAASAIIEPEFGARITSIRLAGREWLQQAVAEITPAAPFDPFVRTDMGGWDEMVPTCTAVTDGGTELPDHGEVWSRPWDVLDGSATHAELAIDCATVPLRVRRRAELSPERLRLDYTLTNMAATATAAFWMAHPLFDASEIVDLALAPNGVTLGRTIANDDEPEAEPHLLPSTLPPGGYRKYRADQPVEAVALTAAGAATLTMSWSSPVTVHFQLWVDHAGVGPVPVVAPEPAIAAGDSPIDARAAGALPLLDPGDTLRFSLDLVASAGDD